MVYTSWASHCDIRPYTGWIIGYNQGTLAQASVLNLVPNGSEGSIWMSDTGPSVDNSGNIYVLDANGDFGTALDSNGFPTNRNFDNAFLKISTSNGLAVADYFEMHNQQQENASDGDLGSGGALILPDLSDGAGKILHLAVGAGKDGHIYVVNRDSMGKFNPNGNSIYQEREYWVIACMAWLHTSTTQSTMARSGTPSKPSKLPMPNCPLLLTFKLVMRFPIPAQLPAFLPMAATTQ